MKPVDGSVRKLRVFLGPIEIAGYYANLKKGLQELGHDVALVDLENHAFGYGGDDSSLPVIRLLLGALKRKRDRERSSMERNLVWKPTAFLLRLLFFMWALFRFDAFVFAYGRSLLSRGDLLILKWFGKKLVFSFHGSDSRPRYVDGNLADGCSASWIARDVRKTRKRVRTIERYADYILVNPLSSQLHERPFVLSQVIGLPVRMHADSSNGHGGSGVRILHAPSNPQVKGTVFIREAIASLREKGLDLEFVEIVGRTNAEVIVEICKCDMVVDQVYSDTTLAGLAAEAAWFGKPSVVGSYGVQELLRYLHPDGRLPVYLCHPDSLAKAIETLARDKDLRQRIGSRAREFVRTQWSPRAVAERYQKLLDDDFPEAWLIDPFEVSYVHGCGMPEHRAQSVVRELVDACGREALQLSHKPELERRFMEFAGIECET